MKILPFLIPLCISFLGYLSVFASPIDDYVKTPDDVYQWELMDESFWIRGEKFGYTGYAIRLTSQRWLTDDVFTPDSPVQSIWRHQLVVIVPDEVKYTQNASLWNTGGGVSSTNWANPSDWPNPTDEDILVCVALALATKSIVSALFQIPNQSAIFKDDPTQKRRSEDALIAYTWDHFISYPNEPNWLVRFPMVKACVRAMDATTEFANQRFGYNLESWAVAGASKRGWTTWLVGAVDKPRVKAIVPVVLDAINFRSVEHHEWRSYGGWGWALQDYLDMNIMARIDDKNMQLLAQYEDPYFFADRLTMPKLIVNAVLDEFQQPDDTHYWYADMPEPKHFFMTPNAEHSMATGIFAAVPAIAVWLEHLLAEKPIPTFSWVINNSTGEIVVSLDNEGVVYEAAVYWGYSCGTNAFDGVNRRDFRIASVDQPCNCGVFAQGYCANLKSFWRKEVLKQYSVNGVRTYSALIPPPDDGRWVAFFIGIKYRRSPEDTGAIPDDEKIINRDPLRPGLIPTDLAFRLMFSTEVSVLPDTFPYKDCADETCDGPIV